MTITAPSAAVTRTLQRSPQTLVVAAIATVLSLAGSWIPSYWGDEAATVMSAERPLSTLWPMLKTVDVVHGVYYVFMHFWIELFGASEFATRLPSALAVGIAAAGVVVLGRRLIDARFAIVAGLVFAVIPRVTFMGEDARSYAIGTAIAVWATVLLAHALRDGRARWWIGYAVLTAAGIYLFLFLGLLIVVHAVWVTASRISWATRWRWAVTVALALLSAAPIISAGSGQRHQVAFIAKRGTVTPTSIAFDQWFSGPWVAIVAWGLIVLGLVVAFRRSGPRWRESPAVLVTAWVVLPTTLLIIVNFAIAPSYSLRYLSFCTPALAFAIALGLRALAARRRQLLAALLLLAVVVPVYLAQRGPYAKNGGSDLRQLADYVASVAHPGDGIAFDDTVRPSRKPRLALRLYPEDFAGLDDIELRTPYSRTTGLWDVVETLSLSTGELNDQHTVWLVESRGSSDAKLDTDKDTLVSQGFVEMSRHRIHRTTVIGFERP